jgi:uncharacterized membrane protein YheB (UPF0754 family)
MNNILLNFLAQAVLGGASGYITNDYAINMLFKEYTPLKIGGVIKKTRTEFIDNLSSMVENDIINKEKLHEILTDEKFKEKFELLTEDFFKENLYVSAGNDKFSDIDGFNSTMSSTDDYVSSLIEKIVPSGTDLIVDSVEAGDFLSHEQLEKISSSLYDFIVEALEDRDILEKFILSLHETLKDYKVNDLLCGAENVSTAIVANIFEKLPDIFRSSSNIDDVSKLLNLDSATNSAKQVFYQREIKTILNIDHIKDADISKQFLDFINSDKGQNLLSKLISSIFEYGKNLDKSIFDLLDSSFENNLKEYIKENLPQITGSIVAWIEENGHSIDQLLEDSIDEIIKESDGLKGKLLSTIKNSYFGNLSQKYSIVKKIISFVEKIAEPEKLSERLSAKSIEILSSMTVAEIVLEAEKNNITAEKLTQAATTYINNNFEAIFDGAVNNAANIKISDIAPDYAFNNLSLKNILSSNAILSMAEKKVKESVNDKLSLRMSDLATEQTTKEIIDKADNLIVNLVRNNSGDIKKLIELKIENIWNSKSSLKSKSIYNQVSSEIYGAYKSSSDKLKDMNVSEALDKLNSIENLSVNSSRSLREYVVNNTDTILKGSIKGIVSSNLNKLSDDDLVDFANEFIGRELKPIMFFGGVLGVAAGLILAAFQNSPADPSSVNAVTMATYAFVGFITNVLAINMLFKPYKEVKILRKIPLLRSFSHGFILKNQKSFAKSTADFIDKSLLSQESINSLINEHESNIKEGFLTSAAEKNYETAGIILSDNKKSISDSVLKFSKNKMSENSGAIAASIYDKAGKAKLSGIITDNMAENIGKEALKSISSDKISSMAFEKINSDKYTLEFASSPLVKNMFESWADRYYASFEDIASDSTKLKNLFLKQQDKYNKFTSRSLVQMLGMEKTERLSVAASLKVSSLATSKSSREKISQGIVKIINRYFDSDKKFEELFDGKLKVYIDKNLPGILKKLSAAVKNSSIQSKDKISLMVQAEIKNSLGFIERGMYSFMGGDAVVDELMKKVMLEKLPGFIDSKEEELNSIFRTVIEDKFYKSKVQVLRSKLDKIEISTMIDRYLDEGNSAKIESNIQKMIKDLISNEAVKDIDELLKFIYINDIESIFDIYGGEIEAFTKELSSSLKTNSNELHGKISDLSDELLYGLSKIPLREILAGTSKEDLTRITSSLFMALEKDGKLQKITAEAFKETALCLNDVSISDVTDREEFIKSGSAFIKKIANSKEFEELASNIMLSSFDEAASDNFSFIDEKTKKYILNMFVDSCILSLKKNLDDILKAVQFDQIAREEIEKMEPKKIHEMFNSFGEKYFSRLMLYGFGGFVFGINMYIGFGLTALKAISGLFDKEK